MPNLAVVLKQEIRRLARKEMKASVTPLRKLVAQLRSRVATQKRLIEELQKGAKRAQAAGSATAKALRASDPQIRFSPHWVRAHRKKLKMSRRIYARLVGVSAQSIFGWERGRTRPRRSALAAWRRLRAMGAREVKALLVAAKPTRRAGAASRSKPARRGKGTRRARKAGRARVTRRGRRSLKKK